MSYKRREFIRDSTLTAMGLSVSGFTLPAVKKQKSWTGKKIGIIGLDTSHAVAFTQTLNNPQTDSYGKYSVVAAYPRGSLDIESSLSRVPGYIEEVKKLGVEIVPNISDLLTKVDVVMLETNDGRRHLEQVQPVLKAGKPVFVDKPIAACLEDTIVIFELARHYGVPLFSSSSLRFMASAQDVVNNKIGRVLGADTYSPCTIEKTHPDFFWYGVHGVELLYTVMGTGCKDLVRVHTDKTDYTVGTWDDGRIGTFRGTRTGKHTYGGTVYGQNGDAVLGPYSGYQPLLAEIIRFFETGISPVKPEETIEIYAFMEAADVSRINGGSKIQVEEIQKRAELKAFRRLKSLI